MARPPPRVPLGRLVSCRYTNAAFLVVFESTELVDKCIGSRIHIVMKSDKEIVGTLLGFDDFVSILWWMLSAAVNFTGRLSSFIVKYIKLFGISFVFVCGFCLFVF